MRFFSNIGLGVLEPIAQLIGGIANLAAWITGAIALVAAILVLIVGPWDFLVWLFNADWRTTHGQAPLWGLAIAIVFGILHALFAWISELAERVEAWCTRREDSEYSKIRASYSDDREDPPD